MQTDDILDLLRPLVVVVDADGTITALRGGFGGFLGLDLDDRVGSSVFDFIAPHDVDELATYFLESTERSAHELTLTLPFRRSPRDRLLEVLDRKPRSLTETVN